MTYTNKINKCIFYTGTTNQFIRKYSSKYKSFLSFEQ